MIIEDGSISLACPILCIQTDKGDIEIHPCGRIVIPDELNIDDAAKFFWMRVSKIAKKYHY
jgi:hypothetical protein